MTSLSLPFSPSHRSLRECLVPDGPRTARGRGRELARVPRGRRRQLGLGACAPRKSQPPRGVRTRSMSLRNLALPNVLSAWRRTQSARETAATPCARDSPCLTGDRCSSYRWGETTWWLVTLTSASIWEKWKQAAVTVWQRGDQSTTKQGD